MKKPTISKSGSLLCESISIVASVAKSHMKYLYNTYGNALTSSTLNAT